MMFFFKLVDADIAEARRVVEGLRQKAIDLKGCRSVALFT